MNVRFSTVIHERGSPETLRDPCGFAVRALRSLAVAMRRSALHASAQLCCLVWWYPLLWLHVVWQTCEHGSVAR